MNSNPGCLLVMPRYHQAPTALAHAFTRLLTVRGMVISSAMSSYQAWRRQAGLTLPNPVKAALFSWWSGAELEQTFRTFEHIVKISRSCWIESNDSLIFLDIPDISRPRISPEGGESHGKTSASATRRWATKSSQGNPDGNVRFISPKPSYGGVP